MEATTVSQNIEEITPEQQILNQLNEMIDACFASSDPVGLSIVTREVEMLLTRADRLGMRINLFGFQYV